MSIETASALRDPEPVTETPVAPVTEAGSDPAVVAGVSAKPGPSLADLIRQDREERSQKAQRDREASEWRTRAEAAEKALSTFKSDHDDMLLDPVGYMTRREFTPEQRAVFAQELLYELVPDRATPEHRAKLVEHQLKRTITLQSKREAEREAARQEQAAREAEMASAKQIEGLARNYAQVAETWTKEAAHPFPTSHAWFADEPEVYNRSLLQTAANMARAASERGDSADLSPRNVARVLEEHMAKKASRLGPRSAEAKELPPTPSAKPALPPKVTDKPLTEAERLARAEQVVFRK